MDLTAIARELVAGCREGRDRANLDVLYAPDAVSVEPMDWSGNGRESHGVDAIKGKHDWWTGSHTIHSIGIDGPFVHGDDRFAVVFDMDVTQKESGNRVTGREVGIYHVADGKIVREEFYTAG